MNCQSCRTEIEEAELGERLSDAARTHIDGCLPCGAFYNERLSLRKLVGSLEPISAPADFDFRLRAKLATAGNGRTDRYSFRSFIASAPAIGLAGAFALLVAAVVIYNQTSTKPAANQTVAAASAESRDDSQAARVVRPVIAPPASNGAKDSNQNNSEVASAGSSVNVNDTPRSFGTKNRNGRRTNSSDANGAQIETHDEAVRSAPQIRPAIESQAVATSSNPLVELPVRSSSQPVTVFVEDNAGGRRSVTLEPVVFGSQELTRQVGFRPVSSQGIW